MDMNSFPKRYGRVILPLVIIILVILAFQGHILFISDSFEDTPKIVLQEPVRHNGILLDTKKDTMEYQKVPPTTGGESLFSSKAKAEFSKAEQQKGKPNQYQDIDQIPGKFRAYSPPREDKAVGKEAPADTNNKASTKERKESPNQPPKGSDHIQANLAKDRTSHVNSHGPNPSDNSRYYERKSSDKKLENDNHPQKAPDNRAGHPQDSPNTDNQGVFPPISPDKQNHFQNSNRKVTDNIRSGYQQSEDRNRQHQDPSQNPGGLDRDKEKHVQKFENIVGRKNSDFREDSSQLNRNSVKQGADIRVSEPPDDFKRNPTEKQAEERNCNQEMEEFEPDEFSDDEGGERQSQDDECDSDDEDCEPIAAGCLDPNLSNPEPVYKNDLKDDPLPNPKVVVQPKQDMSIKPSLHKGEYPTGPPGYKNAHQVKQRPGFIVKDGRQELPQQPVIIKPNERPKIIPQHKVVPLNNAERGKAEKLRLVPNTPVVNLQPTKHVSEKIRAETVAERFIHEYLTGSPSKGHSVVLYRAIQYQQKGSPHPIPPLMHQISLSGVLDPNQKHNTNALISQNQNIQYLLWDQRDIELFVSKYYPYYDKAFQKLASLETKTKISMFLILLTFGGYYQDLNIHSGKKLEDWNNRYNPLDVALVVWQKASKTQTLAFAEDRLASSPGHPLVSEMVYRIFKGLIINEHHDINMVWNEIVTSCVDSELKSGHLVYDDVYIIPE